jgi:hypothetical protein
MRLLRSFSVWLDAGAEIHGRVGFVVFVGTGIAGGFAYLRDRTDAGTAILYLALSASAVLGVILMIYSARADERRTWQNRLEAAEATHAAALAEADRDAAGRVEDERRRTEDRMRAEADQRVQAVRDELEFRVSAATQFGVIVPKHWNAIITGDKDPNAPEVDVIPAGQKVLMGPGVIEDEAGTHVTGVGNRVINSPGAQVSGSYNRASDAPNSHVSGSYNRM